MTQHSVPIVGVHFRQGGKAVLGSLPTGADLRLLREPANPYDPDALQVQARLTAIPDSEVANLDLQLQGYGLDYASLLAADEWFHLGYVANSDKTGGKFATALSQILDAAGRSTHMARLGFLADGKPVAMWEAVDDAGQSQSSGVSA